MKNLILILQSICAEKGCNYSEGSKFIGEEPNRKYILAENGSYSIKAADARCGNRYAVVQNGERGTINPISGYLSKGKLTTWMLTEFNPKA